MQPPNQRERQQPQNPPFRPPGAFNGRGPPFRPPLPPGIPPMPAMHPQLLRPPLPFPPPGLPRPPPIPHMSADEQQTLERIATEYASRPAGMDTPEDISAGMQNYGFLHPRSPLHPLFLWRVSQIRSQANSGACRPPVPPLPPGFRPPGPPSMVMRPSPPVPPGMPPLPAPRPPIPPQARPLQQDHEPAKEEEKPRATKRYHDLPASIMLAAMDESHSPYEPLHVNQLEDSEFLESIVPGLSTYTDKPRQPDTTEDMEMALAHFDKGIQHIYDEGELKDRIAGDVDMDREGWEHGVVERLLWDRRKGSAERKRWKRRQERAMRKETRRSQSGSESSSGSSSSESEFNSTSGTSSDRGSGSDSDYSIPAMPSRAPPASMSRAIGSDNIGFKMLSKMGWKQGEGLGAMAEGIREPIRPPTKFSASSSRSRGSRGGRGKQRPRAGNPRLQRTGSPPVGMESEELYEDYRKHMSYIYKRSSGRMDDGCSP